jgi:hypothetical protein
MNDLVFVFVAPEILFLGSKAIGAQSSRLIGLFVVALFTCTTKGKDHLTQNTKHNTEKQKEKKRRWKRKEDEHEQDDEEGRWVETHFHRSRTRIIKGDLSCVIFPKGPLQTTRKGGQTKERVRSPFSLGSVFGVSSSFFLAFEEGASFAWETGKEDLDERFEEKKERSWIISNHPSPWISLFNIIKVDHQQIEKDGKFFKKPQEENHWSNKRMIDSLFPFFLLLLKKEQPFREKEKKDHDRTRRDEKIRCV